MLKGTKTCLLNIQPSSPNICCDQNMGRATPELTHNRIPFLLRHVTMHSWYGKVVGAHPFSKPIHLAKREQLSFSISRAVNRQLCQLDMVNKSGQDFTLLSQRSTSLQFNSATNSNQLSYTLPFSWYCRKWQPGWWSVYHKDHIVYQTSIPLSQQQQRIVWCPTNMTWKM